jgi:hypothetical protein
VDIDVKMTVNGKAVSGKVEARTLLVQFIREHLRLTGTHVGCDTTQCGCCVVHVDGVAMKSCTMLAVQAEGKAITTIEGLASADGALPVRLVGYGLAVGLDGTGDRAIGGQTAGPTIQSVINILRRFNIEVPADLIRMRNVAAVLVTAEVSPYLRAGGRFEVNVASMGDARSLRGEEFARGRGPPLRELSHQRTSIDAAKRQLLEDLECHDGFSVPRRRAAVNPRPLNARNWTVVQVPMHAVHMLNHAQHIVLRALFELATENRAADLVTCDSDDLANAITSGFLVAPSQIKVIQWGVNTDAFSPIGPNMRAAFGLGNRDVVFSARNFTPLYTAGTGPV